MTPTHSGEPAQAELCGAARHSASTAASAHAPQDSPRRIAFCITELDPGGAERCLVRLATGLPRSHWIPHVFCLGPHAPLVEELANHGVACTCLGWRGTLDGWRIADLARRLRQFRPDLLQTFLFHGNLAGRLAGKLTRVPVIVSGIRVAEREKRWHVWLERATRHLAAHHVCVSQSVAEFAVSRMRLARESVTVIPNGVDVERFAGATPLEPRELGNPLVRHWLLSVGRLHRQKGHAVLIEAVAPLLAAHPDWGLLIAGEGPLRAQLQQQIARLGLEDRIRLLGYRDDVPRLMKSASVFVLASLWEGQPNVVLEALAAGVPVVATDVEAVRDLLQENGTGVIVEAGSPEALRNAVQEFVHNPERLRNWQEHLQVARPQLLTHSEMVARYDALYRRLLQNARPLNT